VLNRFTARTQANGTQRRGRKRSGEPPFYVSTGHLPSGKVVEELVREAHRRFRSNREGKNSRVYPALASVPAHLFGICVVETNGEAHAAGRSDYEFTIMSVSKPFIFALVCEEIGFEAARDKLGVNATGRAFNSLEGIERNADGRTNPMVNSGAIATTSLVPGSTPEAKWRFIHDGLSRFAGRSLTLNDEVYASASATNSRNQSIARLLESYGRIYSKPAEAVDLYTKQCALNVSARD
jgi:glutaminase